MHDGESHIKSPHIFKGPFFDPIKPPVPFPGIRVLGLMVTMLKNTPYFSQNEDFCCKKNHPLFSNFKESILHDNPF